MEVAYNKQRQIVKHFLSNAFDSLYLLGVDESISSQQLNITVKMYKYCASKKNWLPRHVYAHPGIDIDL